MAWSWPQSELPVKAELLIGGSVGWADISGDVRLSSAASGGGIDITRGKSAEGNQADPGKMSLTLDNLSGRYSPRNPNGEWYGLFGRNTPIRLGVTLTEDGFNRTTSNGWGVSPDGDTWNYATGAASDYSINGFQAKISNPNINVLRRIWLNRYWGDVEQVVTVTPAVVATGASIVTGVVARYNQFGYYWFRLEFDTANKVTLKISKYVVSTATHTEIAVWSGIPGWSYTAGQAWRLRASACGERLSVKAWPADTIEPVDWHLSGTDNEPGLHTDGVTGMQVWVVLGNTNPTPVDVSFNDLELIDRRFFGEVTTWPVKWDVGGFDRWVPIEANGILRRLNQGNQAQQSPLRRAIPLTGPEVYWPAEDGIAAGRCASAIAGQPPLSVGPGVEFKAAEDFVDPYNTTRYGVSALADISSGGGLRTYNSVPPEATLATADAWTVGVFASGLDPAIMDTPDTGYAVLEWETPGGTYTRWQLWYGNELGASTVKVLGYRPDVPNLWFLFCKQNGYNFEGGPRFVSGYKTDATHFQIALYEQAGTTPDVLSINATGNIAGIAGSVQVNSGQATATAPVLVGHIAMWAQDAPPADLLSFTDGLGKVVYGPWASWHNELATDRMARLCREQGVRLDIRKAPAGGETRMGWQGPGTFAELLKECAEADGGTLYEQRDGLGLVYAPRRALYNRPEFTISYAAGEVSPPFEPLDDDDAIRNDVTASRKDGSSVRLVQTVGPLAATDPPDGVGVYDTSYTFNLADDRPLPDYAGWYLHLGTSEEARYPAVAVDLAAKAWRASRNRMSFATQVDTTHLVAVKDLPAWLPPGPARVDAQGYTEHLDAFDWALTWNGTPGSAWDVGIAGTSRVAATGSDIELPITSTDLVLQLGSTPSNGPWTTNPAHFPQDLLVGGERVTASAIANSADDTFTRTNATDWGTEPNSGLAYAISGSGTTSSNTNGTRAQHVYSAVSTSRDARLPVSMADVDLYIDIGIGFSATGTANPEQAVMVRWVDGSNFLDVRVFRTTGGATTCAIRQVKGGVETFDGIFPAVPGVGNASTVTLRLQAYGADFRGKVWATGQPEPTRWNLQMTATHLVPGQIVIRGGIGAGVTNTPPLTMFWDNFKIIHPQKLTLTARGVNGVNRAWPAGTSVDVAQRSVFAV